MRTFSHQIGRIWQMTPAKKLIQATSQTQIREGVPVLFIRATAAAAVVVVVVVVLVEGGKAITMMAVVEA